MMGTRNARLLLAAAVLPIVCSGCIAAVAAVGAGGVAYWQYAENEVTGSFAADFDATWEAAVAELEAQGFGSAHETERGVTEGRLSTPDWKLRIERVAGDSTRVRVRIGTFDTDDHQRRSELLLEGIGERLGVGWRAADSEAEADAAADSEPDAPQPQTQP